jgi:hypothetical protein
VPPFTILPRLESEMVLLLHQLNVVSRMFCQLGSIVLLVGLAGCVTTPVRWERTGTPDAAGDAAECRTAAHKQAIEELPYGDGPPLYGLWSKVSMLQWKMAIDNQRTYFEEELVKVCMREKGFVLARTSGNIGDEVR